MKSSVNQEVFKEWTLKVEIDDREKLLDIAMAYGVAVVSKNEQLIDVAYQKALEYALQMEEKYQVKFMESPDGSYQKAMLFLAGVASQVKKKRRQASQNQEEKKKLCKYCGKEIMKDSKFCNHCGKPLEETGKKPMEEVKVFNFGGLSTNKTSFQQINAWLQEQSIEISSITVNTHLYQMFFDIQTVPSRVEIKYHKTDTQKRYKMGYFKSMKMFGTGYEKVEAALEQWKLNNSEKKVVWKTFCGYQIESGSSQSVYFLYI